MEVITFYIHSALLPSGVFKYPAKHVFFVVYYSVGAFGSEILMVVIFHIF